MGFGVTVLYRRISGLNGSEIVCMKFSSDQARIVTELRRNLQLSAKIPNEVFRKAVSVLTTGQDYKVKIPVSKRKRKILACVSWYLPKELSVLIRVQLEEAISFYEPEDQIELRLLLSSEPEMILAILETNVLGENPEEVFGNIRGIPVRFSIVPLQRRKPKPKVRHRGYRDHGSLGPNRLRREDVAGDYRLREEQLELERLRKQTDDIVQFSLGFIQ